jgi:hypothetical protein
VSRLIAIPVFTAVLGFGALAQAECRSSAGGTRSVDVGLSPLSGGACFSTVRAFDGPSCEGAPRFSITLGCSETRRMVPTDRGRLVSLLAPRASRPDWEIVRVFSLDGAHIAVRSVRLDELPFTGRPRLSLDARALRARSGETSVPIATLETLGREVARRRAR